MTTDLVLPSMASAIEKVVCTGDLKGLTDEQRVIWYKSRCDAASLDWRTEPFQYIILNGKLKLYATKTATEQIAASRNVTLQIVSRENMAGCYIVTCRASEPGGRYTDSIGAVPIEGLKGELLAIALMKAETKSKRRAVLSLTGLGMLDESETDAIPGAVTVHPDAVSMLSEAPDTSPPRKPAPEPSNDDKARIECLREWRKGEAGDMWTRKKLADILHVHSVPDDLRNVFRTLSLNQVSLLNHYMQTGEVMPTDAEIAGELSGDALPAETIEDHVGEEVAAA